jgi:peptide/nickel transport system substrate-binding protein
VPDQIDRRSFLARGALAAGGVAAAGGVGGLLSACGSGSGGSGSLASGPRNGITTATPKRGGSLTFGVEDEEQGFDPATARFDETGVLYARTVFDPLTIIASDGSVQPYLAQAITPNSDYTVWTITARPNVRFHDGTPCDAAAIAGSLNHFKDALLGVTFTAVSTIAATSSNEVTVTLKQPWVPFPAYLAGGIGGQPGYIAAPAMIANPKGSENPIGTGPFKFKQWEPNDHFTATANPDYWRKGLPYLDSITYRPITDAQQRANALEAGNIDIMHTDLPESILFFKNNSSYGYLDDTAHIVGEPDMNFIMCNIADPAMSDIRVRQAMAMAINPKQYSQVVDSGVNTPCNQPFVAGTPYYVADAGYPAYNPGKARALVKQLENETGKPVSFSLQSTTSSYSIKVVQYLQNQLQAVGMKVSLTQIQQANQINDALDGLFQATSWRQFAAVDPDLNYLWWSPTEIFGSGASSIAPNFARNTDPLIETFLQQGRTSTDPATRVAAYQGVAKRLNVDLPYIWQDRATWAVVANSKVQNWNNPTTPEGAKAYGMIVGTIWTPQIWKST